METERVKCALVIPTTTDLNRGDQALAWKTVEVAKACGFGKVALLTDGPLISGKDQSSGPGSVGRYQMVAPFILSPRRGKISEDRGFHDSLRNLVRLGFRGVRDLFTMGWMLATGSWPKLCGYPLGPQRRETLRALVESDAVFVKGGGFIHAYGGIRWLYYLLYQLFPILLALRLGKKVVVLPNSYGPFHGTLSRRLAYLALCKCKLVTAREHISAEVMRSVLGRDVPVFPDLAFSLKPSSREWARAELAAKGVPIGQKPCIGITVRPWRFPGHPDPSKAFAQYLDSVEHLLTITQTAGFYPVLFAHSIGPSRHEDDRVAIKALEDRIGKLPLGVSVVDSPDYTGPDLMAMYGEMTLMVATRFHSVIFAAVMGVPSIAVAYGGNKGTGIMAEMGLSDYVIPIEALSPLRLEETFNRLVRELDVARAKVKAYVSKSAAELNSLIDLVKTALSTAC